MIESFIKIPAIAKGFRFNRPVRPSRLGCISDHALLRFYHAIGTLTGHASCPFLVLRDIKGRSVSLKSQNQPRNHRNLLANAPLARAVIGGLTVSTALTLLLIPTLYLMLEERFPRRMEAGEAIPTLQGETA